MVLSAMDNTIPQRQYKHYSVKLSERIRRVGGMCDFNITERRRFNGVEIRQHLDLHSIRIDDLRTASEHDNRHSKFFNTPGFTREHFKYSVER